MALSRYEHTGDAPATGLASGIGSTDSTFTLVSGTGYPTGAVGKFVICIDAGTSSEEKILCSARSGTTVTVATSGRGYDNTTAASHSAGSTNVTHVLAAAEIDDASDHIYTTTRFDHDTQYLRRDGSTVLTGVTSVAAAPGNSAVGDAAAKGSGPTLALSDHKHGRESFGTDTTTSHAADTVANGTATTVAHSDHTHGRVAPAWSSVATLEGAGTTSYTNFATDDTVTFTVPASGKVKVSFGGELVADPAAGWMSVVLGGANTVAASDANGIAIPPTPSSSSDTKWRVLMLTGLTTGSTTFRLQGKAGTSSSMTVQNRQLVVEEA